ncbi:Orf y [Tanacetum coccineum]
MEASFKKHIDSLLKLGVIRPSKSRHRTMAMMVNSGTTVDPATGVETKGKERMVFNYRSLNDNTYKDQYSLPGINTIIQKVRNAKVFSKFDLKSGFHQVAMEEGSIPWTAFLAPGGLYEWLVMPFGLKNAPAIFQRKMDKCFKGTEAFIAVYIDDILVFSKNEEDHAKHLNKMLQICKDKGLILSPTKMKIAVPRIDFLGVVIGEGRIHLQPHIIKKIVEFDEESMRTKKGLRSFLGILNYARQHIPKLGILLRPLYEKTNAHGDKRLKPSDYQLIEEIKRKVQQLPDLSIPPEEAHVILEVDGCMEGWGGIVKWKQKKNDPRSTEKVCAYASGKFNNVQSTIDAEISACINTLEKLKIYYLDKQEITLRTDCQAIISFYKKTSSSKASRVRWMKFADAITGTGVKIEIEHIEGKHNILADSLSRLINACVIACTAKEKEPQMKMVTRTAATAIDKILSENDAWGNEDNSHGTSQRKEQEIFKQISQISNHCHQTIQDLSIPKNRQENTREFKGKPTHIQSTLIPHIPLKKWQEPWKQQPSEMLSQHLQRSMKSCDTRHKYAVEKEQETTTSKMFGLKYPPKPLKQEDCYKKPKSSSICSDTQSEDSNDDDIMVDPGWDDFCLTTTKLPRMEAHRLGRKTRLLLFSKVSIKHFNNIKEQNKVLSEKVIDCENQIKKNQKEFSKSLQQISSEVQGSKPLTKKEVLELVEEIAQQPKKVEEEALKLTAELEKKVKRIENQVHRIEHLVKEVQKFLTT